MLCPLFRPLLLSSSGVSYRCRFQVGWRVLCSPYWDIVANDKVLRYPSLGESLGRADCEVEASLCGVISSGLSSVVAAPLTGKLWGTKLRLSGGEKKPCCTLYTSCADTGRHLAENIKSDIICFCAAVHLCFWTLNDWLTGWKKSSKQGEGREIVRSGSLGKAFKQQQTSQIYVGQTVGGINCYYNCWQI